MFFWKLCWNKSNPEIPPSRRFPIPYIPVFSEGCRLSLICTLSKNPRTLPSYAGEINRKNNSVKYTVHRRAFLNRFFPHNGALYNPVLFWLRGFPLPPILFLHSLKQFCLPLLFSVLFLWARKSTLWDWSVLSNTGILPSV